MDLHDYLIQEIQGGLCLSTVDADNDELFQVAMALLPMGCDIGTKFST